MYKKLLLWILAAGFLIGLADSAQADDVAELRKLMEQQYEQMRQVQLRLIELEKAQAQQGTQLKTIEESGVMSIPETLAWAAKIKIYGDFRFRYEYRDRDWSSDSNSDRFRIRARVGLKARINEEFRFDVRCATAEFFEDGGDTIGGDYVSGNKTLGDYWASKNAWIDRAYVAYTPNWNKDFKFLAGKMYNPFYLPGKSDMVWDHDLNPEGVAVQYGVDLPEADALFANAVAGVIQENGSDSDKRMIGGQVGLAHTFGDESKLTAGLGYFDYSNIKGEEPIVGGAFAGNSNDGTNYLYDYNIMELFGEYAMKIGDMPFALVGDYAMNMASGVDEDTAWLIGCKVNNAKKPGTWQFAYNYRDVEKDAVFGAFTDSDFGDGGANVKGHKFSFAYAVAKNTTVGATYFCAENLNRTPDEDYERLQLDLKVKF